MKITLEIYDIIIIAGFFILTLYTGIKGKFKENTDLDYLVAGRMITLPAFVATLVSTFYGGILGVGEFTYRYGISGWFLNAFPYYIFITIFALYFAKKIRKSELKTIPEKLEVEFGKGAGIFGAFMIFILSTPAPYVFMTGILINLITGFSILTGMLISLIFSILFIFAGGLKSDIRVNIVEFIMMFAGFAIIIPFCLTELGGFDVLSSNLPEGHKNLTGEHTPLYIISWFVIGSWALVDPSFHQRCYAAKNENTAKYGVLISLIFWLIFDFLTTTAGLYSVAFIKDLPNPTESYPALAELILPPVAKGFFLTGMLATIISTLHSYLFISGTSFGVDILPKFTKKNTDAKKLTRIGILIAGTLSIAIPFFIPSIVEIWYTIGSITIPPLLSGVIPAYINRGGVNRKIVLPAMISSFLISSASFLYGNINRTNGIPEYLFGVEPMYPGLTLAFIFIFCGIVSNFLKRKRNKSDV